MTKISGQRLPFQEQIGFLRQKVRVPTQTYKDLTQAQHDKAFVVAGAMKADLLADLHNAVQKAVEDGQAFHQFQANFDEILAKRGWLNDKSKGYQAWRAKIIYQTNLHTSHMAGRYQQMTDPDVLKERPYWRYKHNTVENPRIEHKHWDDLVLPADSPFWRRNYPPNGYGCRCTVEAINERQLKAMGKTKPDELPKDYVSADPRNDFTGIVGETWFPDVNKYPHDLAKALVASNLHEGVFTRWLGKIDKNIDELVFEVVPEQSAMQVVDFSRIKPEKAEIDRLKIEIDDTESPSEGVAGAEWQQHFGVKLERYDANKHKVLVETKNADFAVVDDSKPAKEWVIIDFMFTRLETEIDGIKNMNFSIDGHKKQKKNFEVLQNQILDHLKKSDIVPLDLRHYSYKNRTRIIAFVLSLAKELQEKIVLIGA